MSKNFTLLISVTFITTITLTFPSRISALVVINEVSPVSDPEWVEVLNTSTDSISLENCTIQFGSDSQKIVFTDQDSIGGLEHKAMTQGEADWTSNWLNNDGDEVVLNCLENTDSVSYGNETLAVPEGDQTIGRYPDGFW